VIRHCQRVGPPTCLLCARASLNLSSDLSNLFSNTCREAHDALHQNERCGLLQIQAAPPSCLSAFGDTAAEKLRWRGGSGMGAR